MSISNSNSQEKTNDNPEISPPSRNNSKFNNFIGYVWPVSRLELPKFLSITLLMFCILGIQNLIRATKDSVITTMIGAETISFLKFWGVLPASFLIGIFYVALTSVMKGENIFYLIMSIFIGFFLLFAFYLFPNHEILHLDVSAASDLVMYYPHLKWFILLLSNWSFSLFYVIAELWPSAVFALLFWQFVNKITTVDESKRFYPLFGLLGQTGLYLSGQFLVNQQSINLYFSNLFNLTSNENVISIQVLVTVVAILGIIGLISFWTLSNKILDIATTESLQFKVKKSKISLKDSIKMVIHSRYIRLITILLVCYGFAINLVEGPWKYKAAQIYKTQIEFSAFIGEYLSYTGILTITFVLLGSNIVRRLGWMTAAIFTPIMMISTGLMFFLVTNFDSIAALTMIYFSFSDPIMLGVVIGAVQNVLTKSSKYTLFDSTKEMSYVPLDDGLKTKGKAAADMIGIKLGKSGSALLQSTIFVIVPAATYSSISPFLMCLFAAICLIWIWAIIELNKDYKSVCQNKGEESIF